MTGWRVKAMCADCPFQPAGGIDLRPGRLAEIKDAVLVGAAFYCHKTVYGTKRRRPKGRWLACAGALAFRDRASADAAAAALQRIAAA